MQLHLFRHLWGVDGSWEENFPRFKAAGYVGIETVLPEPAQETRFRDLLKQHGLAYVPQIFTGGKSVTEHTQSFRTLVERAVKLQPLFINVHSGSDAFSAAEALAFYRDAVRIARDQGVAVAHETHRGRVFYNPWSTRVVLEAVPQVTLCCDFSHWVCVCERLLNGCEEIINLAAEHALHVHARVGYEEGPQVPDPSAPEYQRHLHAHVGWWKHVWAAQRRRGVKVSTLTPEFGPPGYLHTLPHTNVPVADLNLVVEWMAGYLRAQYPTA